MNASIPSFAVRSTTLKTRSAPTKRRTKRKRHSCLHPSSVPSPLLVNIQTIRHHVLSPFLLLLLLLTLSLSLPGLTNAFPFSDVSLPAGLHRPFGRRRKYGGAAVADLDGDGWPDLLCGHHGDRSMQIYFNNGDGTFTVSPFSFWRDLHGLNPFRPFPRSPTLYFIASTGGSRGKRPRYPHLFGILPNRSVVDVTERSNDLIRTYRRGRSAIAMSLRVQRLQHHHNHHNHNHHNHHNGNHGSNRIVRQQKYNVPHQPDLLLLNRVDGSKTHHRTFTISSSGVLRHHTLGNGAFSNDGGRYGAVTDLDGDGVMEVLMFGTLRMYKLQRDFFFTEISNNVFPSEFTGNKKRHMVATHGMAELDYDGDGRFDLYIVRSATGTSRFYRRGTIRDMLLRNVDGVRYEDVSVGSGIVIPSPDHKGVKADAHGVTVGDFDNDGYIDVFVVNFHASPAYTLLRNLLGDPGHKPGDPIFEVIPMHLHAVRRSAGIDGDQATAVDYDGDGRLDLVLSEGSWGMDDSKRGNYRIMRNVCANGNAFLIVRVGNAPGWTVTALHAVVTVRVKKKDGGSRKMVRRVGSPGTVVSNSFIESVHFGLGKMSSVGSVEVRWTDGSVQRKENVRANSTIVIGVIA